MSRVVGAAASDVGRIRADNQDVVLCGALDDEAPWPASGGQALGGRGALALVCDGMGGAAGGAIAARLAADTAWSELRAAAITSDAEVHARLLRRAVRTANHAVWSRAQDEPRLRGMGTTLSAAAVLGDQLIVAHVGDSRAYVLRRGVLTQVTRDQSLATALVAAGKLAPGESPSPRAASAILQALGIAPDVEPSLSLTDLREGDRVLVCSDGLHGMLPLPAIAGALAGGTPADAAARLITRACEAGGVDNVTAAVLDVVDGAPPPADDDDQPRFREFDPQEAGADALSTTSTVARRLAARIGLAPDPGRRIPSTGQHASLPARVPTPTVPPLDRGGPATARVAPTARRAPGLAIALAAGVGAVVVLAIWYLS